MEEDEDDFYGGGGQGLSHGNGSARMHEDGLREEHMDVTEDQEEEDEEDDSDDDVKFTLEKPPESAQAESTTRTTRRQAASQEASASVEPKPARSTPPIKQEQRQGSTAIPAAVRGTVTYNGRQGSEFPDIRTSSIDVNGTPTWPDNGKPITKVDLDADLAENSKLWRLPGTDQTDFFNYGFDEYTWAQYCLRQQTMTNTITEQKQADEQMKAMFGGGGNVGGGANAAMPAGMPAVSGMPAMPSPEEFMQMMQSGINPNDPAQMLQWMMNNSGMGGQGQQNSQGGGGNFGQQGGGGGGGGGGGYGGSNQNSGSPHPQAGQGFQPPQGMANQHAQGDQGGFPPNMEGYSPQQIAIMQQQQGGGSGRGRGGRRGRGYY